MTRRQSTASRRPSAAAAISVGSRQRTSTSSTNSETPRARLPHRRSARAPAAATFGVGIEALADRDPCAVELRYAGNVSYVSQSNARRAVELAAPVGSDARRQITANRRPPYRSAATSLSPRAQPRDPRCRRRQRASSQELTARASGCSAHPTYTRRPNKAILARDLSAATRWGRDSWGVHTAHTNETATT